MITKRKAKSKSAKRKRDYKKEYREYHGKPEQIKRRDARNKARRRRLGGFSWPASTFQKISPNSRRI